MGLSSGWLTVRVHRAQLPIRLNHMAPGLRHTAPESNEHLSTPVPLSSPAGQLGAPTGGSSERQNRRCLGPPGHRACEGTLVPACLISGPWLSCPGSHRVGGTIVVPSAATPKCQKMAALNS